MAPVPGGHHQPQPSPGQALRLLWLWLEEPLAQESRNSDAWAGEQGLGRCQADRQIPGRLHGAASGREELQDLAFGSHRRDAPILSCAGGG